jgi:predicted PurR-regulated permease PerM
MTPGLDPRKRFSLFCLIGLLFLLLYGVYLIVLPFSKPILWAILLTLSFQPVFRLIRTWIRNQSGAALLTIFLMVLVVLGPLTYVGIKGAIEGRELYFQLEAQSQQEGGWTNYYDHLVEAPLEWVAQKTGVAAPDLRVMLLSRVKAMSTASLSWASSLFSNIASTIGTALLVLFIMFFLFRSGSDFHRLLITYVPLGHDRTNELLNLMASAIVANLYGMVAVAGLQGILVGLGFAIARLPSPVIWGTMASFASLIPLVGTALIWVPGVITLVVAGSYGKAVFLLIWCAVLVGMVDNVIRPLLLKKGVELNTLMIFFALMGGVQAFGVLGLFAGPVIFSMTQAVFRILREEELEWERRLSVVSAQAGKGTVPPEAAVGE